MADLTSRLSALWTLVVGLVLGLVARQPRVEGLRPPEDEGYRKPDLSASTVEELTHALDGIQRQLSRPWYRIPLIWVALLGEVALIWQVLLTQDLVRLQGTQIRLQGTQIEQQAQQILDERLNTLIVRKAQLLATIYDCADSHSVDVDLCRPKASARIRAEAIRAFVEIEYRHDRTPELKQANLSGLELGGLDLNQADLSRANLEKIDLNGADLSGAFLTEAQLGRADLSGAVLSGADLIRADLSGAALHKATLVNAALWDSNLTAASLSEADCSGADLSGADLRLAMLEAATLVGADFLDSNLTGVSLNQADLSGADLSGADLSYANLAGAVLDGAELWEADLESSLNLTQAQIDSALGNSKTKLPEGLLHPAEWQK